MSVLTLVRHGQASYMEADYDKLSLLGEEQARKLGHFWVRHGLIFDRVFHGPANRHIRTMEIAGSVVKAAGLPWPDPQEVTDLDEFDAFTMMRVMAPVLIDIDPEIRMLSQAFEENRDTPEAGRLLQKFFEAACRKWASGDVETPPVETWAQFRQRIGNSIDNLRRTAEPSTSTVAFTSGGPIAATIGFVLDLTAAKAIEFVWLSRNCSWTQFLHSGERFSMHSFNAIPHLDDLSLFSYR